MCLGCSLRQVRGSDAHEEPDRQELALCLIDE